MLPNRLSTLFWSDARSGPFLSGFLLLAVLRLFPVQGIGLFCGLPEGRGPLPLPRQVSLRQKTKGHGRMNSGNRFCRSTVFSFAFMFWWRWLSVGVFVSHDGILESVSNRCCLLNHVSDRRDPAEKGKKMFSCWSVETFFNGLDPLGYPLCVTKDP